MKKIDFSAELLDGTGCFFLQKNNQGTVEYVLPKSFFSGRDGLTVFCQQFDAIAGEEGYYLLPGNEHTCGSSIVYFRSRENGRQSINNPLLSLFAVSKQDATYLVLIQRDYTYTVNVTYEEGKYRLFLNFDFSEQFTDDDIVLRLITLPAGSDYNAVARCIRNYKFAFGELRPLKDKCSERPAVEYNRKYPLIRIRMGWKPVPPKVLHQTPENEPPMYVACTFREVRELADELHRQGLEGAEICLVGWNQKGHDGRWPQIFPVEEALGGEEELRKTVSHVQSLGYRITCHTNSVNHYEIADNFDWDAIAVKKDGYPKDYGMWAGGTAYDACPEKQLSYAKLDLPRVAALGFSGLHYIDVLSIVMPDICFHPEHPCKFKRSIECLREIMRLSRDLFGGFSSEGGFDFAWSELDYCLYNSFGDYSKFSHMLKKEMVDLVVPLFELVCHGSILYNISSSTVNYSIKEPNQAVSVALYGGRPTFYYYSKFVDVDSGFLKGIGTNWMGNLDMTCHTKEALQHSVEAICQAQKEYEKLADRQLVLLDSYKLMENGLRVMTYEDGVTVIGNYSDGTLVYQDVEVLPHSYRVVR